MAFTEETAPLVVVPSAEQGYMECASFTVKNMDIFLSEVIIQFNMPYNAIQYNIVAAGRN